MWVTIHEKEERENRARKKRGIHNIPILSYTESEEKKRKIKTPKQRKSAEKRNSHIMPILSTET